jgi:hypothetical protein
MLFGITYSPVTVVVKVVTMPSIDFTVKSTVEIWVIPADLAASTIDALASPKAPRIICPLAVPVLDPIGLPVAATGWVIDGHPIMTRAAITNTITNAAFLIKILLMDY